MAFRIEEPQNTSLGLSPLPHRGLVKPLDPGLPPRVSDSTGLKWNLRTGISGRLPGAADAAVSLGATF